MIGRAMAALLCGLLFGLGLALSQMTNPDKVLSFLRLLPGWDASLLLVMAAAVTVTFAGYRAVVNRKPLLAEAHALPGNTQIDRRLLGGAAIFGVGWGLAGFCPGPAIAAITGGSLEPLVFLAAMVGGSQLARLLP